MVEKTEIIRIKCGQVYILSTDYFSIICEFCDEDFYTLDDLRAHLKEHFQESPPNITKEEPVVIKYEINIPSDAEYLMEENLLRFQHDDDGSDSIVAEGSLFVEESSPIKLEDTPYSEQSNGWEGWAIRNDVKVSTEYQSTSNDVKEDIFYSEENEENSKEGLYSHLLRTGMENSFTVTTNSTFEDVTDSNGTNGEASNIEIPESDDLQTQQKMLFECNYCSQKFRCQKNRNYHENMHTGKLPQCRKCFKTFSTFENLTNHLKLHTEDLQCKLCSRIFINKTKLNAHTKLKHLPKTDPIPCTLCDVKLTSAYHLKQHMEAHKRKTAIYTCDYCRKQFKLKGTMAVHMKVHADLYIQMHSGLPYKCNYCQLTFTRNSGKTIHERRCKRYVLKQGSSASNNK